MLQLGRAEFERLAIILRREIWKFLFGTAILIAFYFLFSASMRFSLANFAALSFDDVSRLYVIWLVLIGGLTTSALEVESDIEHGVMERLSITGTPLASIIAWRSLFGLVPTAITVTLMYAVASLVYNTVPTLSPAFLLAVLVTVFVGIGFGFLGAGLAFVFRPSALILLPIQLLLLVSIVSIGMTQEHSSLVSLAPLGPSIFGFMHPTKVDPVAVIFNALAYLALGWFGFRYLEGRARQTGMLSR